MAEAMAEVRHELGDDAIIVSTQRAAGGQGVRITAALEEVATDDEVHLALSGSLPSPVADQVREHLVYHGLPPRLIERMVSVARDVGSEDPTMACAGALDALFSFAPLPERQAPHPFVMIGPPGSGKTIAVAKLAARGRLNGRSVGVISADTVRAGALEQLSAFTKILSVDLRKARGGRALTQLLHEEQGQHDLVFIDTPGLNPFYPSDMDYLRDLIADIEVEPVLVMAAGGDPVEAAEMAEAFSEIGASRLLATRLDMTRRLGAILAAADAAQFMFCDVSINPHIVNGLCPINPVSMARLLVPPEEIEPEEAEDFPEQPDEAAEYAPSNVGDWQSGAYSGYGLENSDPIADPEPEDRPSFSIFDDFDPDGENPEWIDRTNEVRR
jgi:flagellar biosynthesis protein FlhF